MIHFHPCICFLQGYLAQALSFEYQLPVVAIDASSHHASVTNTRAERIKKYYTAKWCDFHQFNHTYLNLNSELIYVVLNKWPLFLAV
jgi:hypothetical protein